MHSHVHGATPMKIAEEYLLALRVLGYTDCEARFLYLAATHSGYFVPRQFNTFADVNWGIAVLTGMRIGEIIALRWKRVAGVLFSDVLKLEDGAKKRKVQLAVFSRLTKQLVGPLGFEPRTNGL